MEIGTLCCRPRRGGSSVHLKINRAQAGALARLIRSQLDAYTEAIGGPSRKRRRPFTVADLGRVEPLLTGLEMLS